jgi:hypothetical protein
MVCLRIKPKSKVRVDEEKVGEMVKAFRQMYAKWYSLKKRVWVKWQIIRDLKGMIEFRIIAPKKHAGGIVKRFGNAYPDVNIVEEEITIPDFYEPEQGEMAHMKLNTFPWQKERGLNQQMLNRLGDILHFMPYGSILELTFSPSSLDPIQDRAEKVIKQLEQKQTKANQAKIQAIRERYTGNRTAFDVYIDVWSRSNIGGFLGEISEKTQGYAKLKGKQYLLAKKQRNPLQWGKARTLAKWQSSRLTDREIAPFFMLPEVGHPIWQYIECEKIKPRVLDEHFQGHYALGLIDSDDVKQKGRPARLKVDTLTNHGLIAGSAGGGKGSLLMELVLGDFLEKWVANEPNSLGMTICDPHTEDIYWILAFLIDLERTKKIHVPWDRVAVVSFGDEGRQRYPVAANLLHLPVGADIDQVAEDTKEVILNAFNSENLSRSADALEKALQGLLGIADDGEVSLLDIVRLFENGKTGEALREKVIDKLREENPVVATWWEKQDAEIRSGKSKNVDAIETRLGPLVSKKGMQRLFCREGNFFSRIPEFLEEGYLVLIDFRGQGGEELYRLGAAWLAKQYFNASQARGTNKRPHLLVFDEVQKFDASQIFSQIIRENRKFNLGLLLLTQQVEELDQTLKNAIKSNAGFVASVRQEAGAKAMADLLGDPFTADELRNLIKGREAALRAFDGKARINMDYPGYYINGKRAERGSTDEQQAKQQAEAKFLELLASTHATADQADEEVKRFVYGGELKKRRRAAGKGK